MNSIIKLSKRVRSHLLLSLKDNYLVQLVVQFLELSVEIISASEARANLFGLVEQVNQDHSPRVITSRKGDAVLLSKADWESIQETLYLQSIPGFVESIREAERANDWRPEAEFLQALDEMEN